MAKITNELFSALPALTKAVFSQSTAKEISKLIIRPVVLKGRRLYQAESFRDNKASHVNLSEEELLSYAERELEGRFRQVLIITEEQSLQYCLKRDGSYKKTASAAAVTRPGEAQSHNREKEYILREGECIPALVELGVFTQDYKVVRSKYDKYRQINRFVELVAQAFPTGGGEISILDFGCGKSYLTFILYYFFSVKRGMNVQIIGYDLKADVVEHCNELARKYGYEGLKFYVADVTKDTLAEHHIDMVVSLHACDIATDYALHYAISRGVKHIFSVPCCQHEVNSTIHNGGDLDILLENGIIKERVCALLTDSIRAAVLESEGYAVDMIEFIDLEHSPKNLMLRCERKGGRKPKKREHAEALQAAYGFKQTLLELTKGGAAEE